MGIWCRIKVTQKVLGISTSNSSAPFTLSVLGNTLVARAIIFKSSFITSVLCFCRLSKIAPFIVGWIEVPVIGFFFRPRSCHPQPNDPVGVIFLIEDANLEVPSFLGTTGDSACGPAITAILPS